MPKAITTDPDIRDGVPCIAGTDVTVATILRFLAGTTQLRMTWENCPPDKMAAALNELADIYEQAPEPSSSIDVAAKELSGSIFVASRERDGREKAIREILTRHFGQASRAEDRPKIVCLCGSTRFMGVFFEAGWQLTLDGYIVLSVGVCKHAEHHGAEALGQDVAERLDELHLRKIDLADWVFILNVGGYIGESTRRELEYAKAHGKQVSFLEPNAVLAAAGEKGQDDVP